MTQLNNAHANMVNQQVRPNEVLDARVLAAMTDIAREDFVEPEFKGLAYADVALPIGFGQYLLPPMVEGRILQTLALQAEETVLEIGTGSGYFTALLAKLAGKVISVEYFEELSKQAKSHLQALNISNVQLEVGDAAKQWTLPDRIDAIVITAGLVNLPEAYLHSLKVGGRMVAIVGKAPAMSVQLIKRVAEREWQTSSLFETVVPPMIHAEPKAQFEF